MSIATYTDLKTAIASWLHRDDLLDQLDNFTLMAEAGLNRNLRHRGMEAAFASVALDADGAASLPADFLAFKELRFDGSRPVTLEPRPIEWIRNQPVDADQPRYYAVTNTQVVCWPTAGSIKGTYYQRIPSLTANSTNWLLTSHPDLYLSACLTEAGLYVMDGEFAQMWRERARALIDEIQGADTANRLGGGPLATRVA